MAPKKPLKINARLMNQQIQKLVDTYVADIEGYKYVRRFLRQISGLLTDTTSLNEQIHSIKFREKDPEHLRRKLERKYHAAAESGRKFHITPKNLFTEINDLAGVRLLHLHTKQFEGIDQELRKIFDEYGYQIKEGPVAKTWDDEYREYFKGIGVKAESSSLLYTSVHYVIGSLPRADLTCEIQVRTLAEELWGEVSHQINYPTPTKHISCTEQIKTLARATSTATRLVDSIYSTLEWEKSRSQKNLVAPKKTDQKPKPLRKRRPARR